LQGLVMVVDDRTGRAQRVQRIAQAV